MGSSIPTTLETNSVLVQGFVVFAHLAILILLYAQTYSFDYVHFDDVDYVLENSAVHAGLTLDGIQWAFTSFYMSNWHPLTWLSHMLDVSLFGVDPGWAHLHNMALHGVNSLLVYVILLKISGSWWKACILSLVFLVHPLHVESVAWIAERKDLLCAFFFLLGLLLYDSYRARPGTLLYAGVLIAYVLALMAKPMAVTFPVVLLILDFFVYRRCFQIDTEAKPGARFNYFSAIVEKLPLFALSVAMSAVTIAAQDAGDALAYVEAHPISYRWTIATTGYVTYLKQFLIPVDLVAMYPIPVSESTSLIDVLVPSLILLLLVVLAAIFARRYPLIAAGLCWYLVTLLPVIGLVQVGSQAHADRYMYLPSIGVLLSCVYLLPSREKKQFRSANMVSVFIIVYLSLISYWQISYWKNQNTLFSRQLDVIGPNYWAHIHLARDYLGRGMLKEARQHSTAAMDIRPDLRGGYQVSGHLKLAEREFQEAEKFFRLALSKGGEPAILVNNIGIAMAEQGNTSEGIEAFEMALQIDPTLNAAQENLRLYRAKMEQEAAP